MRGGVAVEEAENRPSQEGTENALEAEPLGQGRECHQQQDGEADPDLCGGVLEEDKHLAKPAAAVRVNLRSSLVILPKPLTPPETGALAELAAG